MEIKVYGNGFVTDEVSTIPVNQANLNEENRIKFLTDLAVISRGKHESNNPPVRYKQLLKEAAPVTIIHNCPICKSTDFGADLLLGHETGLTKCYGCGYVDEPTSEAWFKNQEGSPSRPTEFIPVVLTVTFDKDGNGVSVYSYVNGNKYTLYFADVSLFINNLGKFAYIIRKDSDHHLVYTNMRACINAGMAYESIPYNTLEELLYFKAIRVKAPMFVFNHLVTHTALSKEARSERVTELSGSDYWLPSDFRTKVYAFVEVNSNLDDATQVARFGGTDRERTQFVNNMQLAKNILSEESIDGVVKCLLSSYTLSRKERPFISADLSQEDIQVFFKTIGYPKEIYQRAMLEFRYKEFVLTGWSNDPKTWNHLCRERNARPAVWINWTQKETQMIVEAIDKVVFEGV